MASSQDSLTRWLLSHRQPLFAYINAIVRDHTLAEDVFQDVSLIVLKKQDLADAEALWIFARGVAKNQALAAMRTRKRHAITLSSEAMDSIDSGFDQVAGESEARIQALTQCIQTLPEKWREIVHLRYWSNLPVGAIAERLKHSRNALSVTLNRIRSRLADCVSRRMGLDQTR